MEIYLKTPGKEFTWRSQSWYTRRKGLYWSKHEVDGTLQHTGWHRTKVANINYGCNHPARPHKQLLRYVTCRTNAECPTGVWYSTHAVHHGVARRWSLPRPGRSGASQHTCPMGLSSGDIVGQDGRRTLCRARWISLPGYYGDARYPVGKSGLRSLSRYVRRIGLTTSRMYNALVNVPSMNTSDDQVAAVAQFIERCLSNWKILGSIPATAYSEVFPCFFSCQIFKWYLQSRPWPTN